MEHESFEDNEVAEILNNHFIAIKVDKEERPDIDSIYMKACQAMTGSGGWPLTIVMNGEKLPFYAGTYLPKHTRFQTMGLIELLQEVIRKWNASRNSLNEFSNRLATILSEKTDSINCSCLETGDKLAISAYEALKRSFDKTYGGFGVAPKFLIPHDILFLLQYYKESGDEFSLQMAEKTLVQMYKGGIFDHVGYGFSRYSTDDKWLAPHFEKMLYDNALLIMSYVDAYELTRNELYKQIAEKTIQYVLNELTSEDGGFYCAQDADSEGEEGKYYVFTPDEIIKILGKAEGSAFNDYFDITVQGNFEGKNIPNLIHNNHMDNAMDPHLSTVYNYRKQRMELHKDDKFLASWNGLMIAALSKAYGVLGHEHYLQAAERAVTFVETNLCEGDTVFASFRQGKASSDGYIDDYAFFIWGLIELYRVSLKQSYLKKAEQLMRKCIAEFWDDNQGGFFLYGKNAEQLFIRPKETYDGAVPSGNSVMAYNFVMLAKLLKLADLLEYQDKQFNFMAGQSGDYPKGHSFFLSAFLLYRNPLKEIVCVLAHESDYDHVAKQLPKNAFVTILLEETEEYHLLNGKTTFYICEHNKCLAPVNEMPY